jgi:hypothetical protein
MFASKPRSFFPTVFPDAANFAEAPSGVAFELWPPVFE